MEWYPGGNYLLQPLWQRSEVWHAVEQQIEEHVAHYAKQNSFVGPVGPSITEEGWENSWPEEPAEPTQPQHEEAMETDDPPPPYTEYAKARTARIERAMEEHASGRYDPPHRSMKGSGKGADTKWTTEVAEQDNEGRRAYADHCMQNATLVSSIYGPQHVESMRQWATSGGIRQEYK